MSLCVYGRIEERSKFAPKMPSQTLNEKSLETCLNHYFSNGYEIKGNSDCAVYEIKNDESKTIVSFINEKKSPYNIYDSDIIEGEFECHQLLVFELDKEGATINLYIEIMRFLKYLSQETKNRILVTSDAHDEICLLDDKNISWSKNSTSIKEIMNSFNSQD